MIGHLFASTRLDRILALLDEERKVILNGPLSQLAAIVERRERAFADLTAQGPDLPEAFLAALKARAERNARLLRASIAGVKAARAQLERIEDTRGSLRTYNAAGASVEVRPRTVTRDQRA